MRIEDVTWSERKGAIEHLPWVETFAVGLRVMKKEEPASKRWLLRPPQKLTLCHVITLARMFDRTVAGTPDALVPLSGPSVQGLPFREYFPDGIMPSVLS